MKPHRNAFTLIELLVVVTIILVLMSLLSPALDKAVYQAELAVCGSHQHAATVGLSLYAAAQRRQYAPRSLSAIGPANMIYASEGAAGAYVYHYDDRSPYQGYMDFNKALNDPLVPYINLTENLPTTSMIQSPLALWAGYYVKDGKAMRKVGDRMLYADGTGASAVQYTFDVMVGDMVHNSWLTTGNPWGLSSHPDKGGEWHLKVYQDAPNPWLVNAGAGGVNVGGTIAGNGGGNASTVTLSYWLGGKAASALTAGDFLRDVNFAFQDGSVRRYNDVLLGYYAADPRMNEIYYWGDKGQNGSGVTDQAQQLPKEQ